MTTDDAEVTEIESTALTPHEATRQQGFGLAQLTDIEFSRTLEMGAAQRRRLVQVHREVMQEGVDYGKIPGTDKDTLLKGGAEILNKLMGYVVSFSDQLLAGDNQSRPAIHWRCVCTISDPRNPAIKWSGSGACNSWESKYRYRTASYTCPDCGSDLRRSKHADEFYCWAKTGGCGAKFPVTDPRITGQTVGKVENPDPWDLDNTILKMAQKRALVAATLFAHAASGSFTQDLEELEAAQMARDAAKPTADPPQKAPPAASRKAGSTNGGQLGPIHQKLKSDADRAKTGVLPDWIDDLVNLGPYAGTNTTWRTAFQSNTVRKDFEDWKDAAMPKKFRDWQPWEIQAAIVLNLMAYFVKAGQEPPLGPGDDETDPGGSDDDLPFDGGEGARPEPLDTTPSAAPSPATSHDRMPTPEERDEITLELLTLELEALRRGDLSQPSWMRFLVHFGMKAGRHRWNEIRSHARFRQWCRAEVARYRGAHKLEVQDWKDRDMKMIGVAVRWDEAVHSRGQ